MPQALTGLAGELGFKRRDNPAAYERAWRDKHRDERNAYNRAYHERRKAEPEYRAMKKRSETKVNRRRKSGISWVEFERRLTSTQGKCEICDKDCGRAIQVDHCHATGVIRGLLCNSCNNGLGRFKDKPELLEKAVVYLKRTSPNELDLRRADRYLSEPRALQ